MYLTIFLDILSASISAPVLPFYAKGFGCSSAMIGLLFSTWSLTSALFPPYFGKL